MKSNGGIDLSQKFMRANRSFIQTKILRAQETKAVAGTDWLAAEEPLEIRLGFYDNGKLTHKSISITMRTPGADDSEEDFELAAGFLFTEGIVKSKNEIEQIFYCGLPDNEKKLRNTVRINLRRNVTVDLKRLERHFYTSSSCGVCGKSSIEALDTGARRLKDKARPIFAPQIIHRLPALLLDEQNVFAHTGGLHAAALFDRDGGLEILREDVGRHNAVDKLIGTRFLAGKIPLEENLLLVSGRASFELVQKALMAEIPILAAVGSPSSLAVELAERFGMTVLGFVRDNRFNVYTHAERIGGVTIEKR